MADQVTPGRLQSLSGWACVLTVCGEGALANGSPSPESPQPGILGPGELAKAQTSWHSGPCAHAEPALSLEHAFSHLVLVSLDEIPSVTLSHLLPLPLSLLPNSK